ncbi:hypothetical protein ACOME3_006616 [Neoechinorhynchus agilis]
MASTTQLPPPTTPFTAGSVEQQQQQRQIRNQASSSSTVVERQAQQHDPLLINTMTFRSQKLENDRRILIVDQQRPLDGESASSGGGGDQYAAATCVRTLNIPITLGMEKEEETEVHLVRALEIIGYTPPSEQNDCLPSERRKRCAPVVRQSALLPQLPGAPHLLPPPRPPDQFAIPTPICEAQLNEYELIYSDFEYERPSRAMQTLNCKFYYQTDAIQKALRPFAVTVSDPCYPLYDADDDDQKWISTDHYYARSEHEDALSKFEETVCVLEAEEAQSKWPPMKKASRNVVIEDADDTGCDNDQTLQMVDVEFEQYKERIRTYWLHKRKQIGHSMIPTLMIGTAKSNAADPYIVFRRRSQKMQTRKKQNVETEETFAQMLETKLTLAAVLNHLELCRQREVEKRDLIELSKQILHERLRRILENSETPEELMTSLNIPDVGVNPGSLFVREPPIATFERRNTFVFDEDDDTEFSYDEYDDDDDDDDDEDVDDQDDDQDDDEYASSFSFDESFDDGRKRTSDTADSVYHSSLEHRSRSINLLRRSTSQQQQQVPCKKPKLKTKRGVVNEAERRRFRLKLSRLLRRIDVFKVAIDGADDSVSPLTLGFVAKRGHSYRLKQRIPTEKDAIKKVTSRLGIAVTAKERTRCETRDEDSLCFTRRNLRSTTESNKVLLPLVPVTTVDCPLNNDEKKVQEDADWDENAIQRVTETRDFVRFVSGRSQRDESFRSLILDDERMVRTEKYVSSNKRRPRKRRTEKRF